MPGGGVLFCHMEFPCPKVDSAIEITKDVYILNNENNSQNTHKALFGAFTVIFYRH